MSKIFSLLTKRITNRTLHKSAWVSFRKMRLLVEHSSRLFLAFRLAKKKKKPITWYWTFVYRASTAVLSISDLYFSKRFRCSVLKASTKLVSSPKLRASIILLVSCTGNGNTRMVLRTIGRNWIPLVKSYRISSKKKPTRVAVLPTFYDIF